MEPSALRAGEMVNLISPHEWFILERLPGRGYERWATAWPGIFLTVGLLFTFIGLAAALLLVSDIGEEKDMVAATDGVLRISSAKFMTSIAGLVCYIGWTIAAKRITTSQANTARKLADAIQGLSTPLQPEALLFMSVAQLTIQSARLEAAPGCHRGSGSRAVRSRRFGPCGTGSLGFDALARAFEKTAIRLAQVNEDAVAQMASKLGNDIRLGAGVEIRAVVSALRDAASELAEAKSSIAAGASRCIASCLPQPTRSAALPALWT